MVPGAVTTALRDYISDSATLADMLERDAPTAERNTRIDEFNATKDSAVEVCDDYRHRRRRVANRDDYHGIRIVSAP